MEFIEGGSISGSFFLKLTSDLEKWNADTRTKWKLQYCEVDAESLP